MSGRPRSPRRGDHRRDDRDGRTDRYGRPAGGPSYRDGSSGSAYPVDDRRDRDRRRSPTRYDRERYPDSRGSRDDYAPRDFRRSDDHYHSRPGRRLSNDVHPRDERRQESYRPRDGLNDKRSRDVSPARDGRFAREDSRDLRDPKRPRRGDSIDSTRRSARNDEQEAAAKEQAAQEAKAALEAEEERKRQERQAKVLEWKKKLQSKQQQQQAGATDAMSPTGDVSATTASSAASPAPQSTASVASPAPQSTASVASPSPQPDGSAAPPTTTKPATRAPFDHKAIARNAKSAAAKLNQPLGSDFYILGKSKSAVVPATTRASHSADHSSSKPVLGNVKPFSTAAFSDEKHASTHSGPTVDMDDERVERRKLEKLPALNPNDNIGDAMHADLEDTNDDDMGLDMANASTEEEMAAAARAAAEKRAAAASRPGLLRDIQPAKQPTADVPMGGEDDKVDTLDAYMASLNEELNAPPANTMSKKRAFEPELLFGDDDAADMDAINEDPDELLAMVSKKRKKEVPTVDHTKVQYEAFRKDFYIEPQELREMSEEDAKVLRFELDDIKVQGKDVPKPVQKFAQFGLGSQVLDILRNLDFEKPTPIQAQTVPAIMSGRDVIGVAKTGSGKTMAFLLPMFRHIKDQPALANLDGPIGLVLAPTRELAQQIHRECKPYLVALKLRAICAYGGAPIKDQIAELKRGAEIVVCTPGRMVDLLAANSGRVTNLRRVTYVVLDEADRMFDMGFEPQVLKILNNIRPDRQTVLFSATMPKNIESLVRKVLRKPVQITIGGRSTVSDTITQVVEVRPETTKMFRTLDLLGQLFADDDDVRALIFVERQESADKIMLELQRKGYPASSIHGGREQIDREQAIDDFKRGNLPVLVATSVAARGLDVKQLKLVINYDVPNHLEDYVHRSGRTGRAGNTGTAVTFITEDQEKYAVDLVKALKMSKQPVPEDLAKLSTSFLAKMKEGKVKASGTGFGGRGIERLEEQRAAERARERKAHRLGDEPDEEEEEEKKNDAALPAINIIKRGTEPGQAASPPPVAAAAAEAPSTSAAVPAYIASLNTDVKVIKTEVPSATAPTSALSSAALAASKIAARLGARNSTRPGVPIDNKGPDAGAYHATLEINDFPQKARWGVTNRTNVAKILDAYGVSITSKGTYYPPGSEPAEGQLPKLYILVEGDTENQVTLAMRELQRHLRDGVAAAMEADSRATTTGGRYTV